jgi:hypothetical protein
MEELNELPDITPRSVDTDGPEPEQKPVKAPKQPKGPKSVVEVKSEKTAKNDIKDEDGKPVTEMMDKDVVPALVRPTEKAADTMAFHERIAYEKKIRDEERRKNKLPIIVKGFGTINEY